MLEILNNKYAFYNIKPKKYLLLPIATIFFIILIILLINIKVYDNYQTKGYTTCNNGCTITTYLPTNIDYEAVYLDNKKEKVQMISSIIKVDQEKIISYQELTFTTKKSLKDNEIVTLNFYYHKQRLIKKIKDLMF